MIERSGDAARIFGLKAEIDRRAAAALKGYTILARRFMVTGGEIDLIARRGGSIAFIEVKARADLEIAAISISAMERGDESREPRGSGYRGTPGRQALRCEVTQCSSRPDAFPVTRRPRIGWRSTNSALAPVAWNRKPLRFPFSNGRGYSDRRRDRILGTI